MADDEEAKKEVLAAAASAYGASNPKKPSSKFPAGFQSFNARARARNAALGGGGARTSEPRAGSLPARRQAGQDEEKAAGGAAGVLYAAIQQTSSQNLGEIQQVLLAMAQQHQQGAPEKGAEPGAGRGPLPGLGKPRAGHEALTSQILNESLGGESKYQIKKLIDELYNKEKRYTRKHLDRGDLVCSNAAIFDLSRAWGPAVQGQAGEPGAGAALLAADARHRSVDAWGAGDPKPRVAFGYRPPVLQ